MRRDFLRQFEVKTNLAEAFHSKEMESIVREVRKACEDGFLQTYGNVPPPIGLSDKVWWTETFILTDKGLVYCGLKKPQQEKVRGLFDE